MIKIKSVTASQAGHNTGWIGTHDGQKLGYVDISIECDGSWAGTIQLQKTRNDGATIHVVKEYTGDAQEYVRDPVPGVLYRLYCSARTAGSAVLELYK